MQTQKGDFAENLEAVPETNIATEEKLLQNLSGKDVVKTKTLNVAGQLFTQYGNELGESKQMIENYENCIGHVKNLSHIRNFLDVIDCTHFFCV